MTSSRKICPCLALLIVLTAATGREAAAQAPTVEPPKTTATYAQAGAPKAAVVPVRYTGWSFPGSDDENLAIESPLVIPAGEMTVEATGQIIEDLMIMARIIEKHVLGSYSIERSAYQDVFFLGDSLPADVGPRVLFPSIGRPRPLYIAGHGALFFIQVDFPLMAPPETEKKQPADAEADPVWSQTRRSLLEPRSTGAAPGRDEAVPPFSQGKVDSLRRALVVVMKQAANIRALGPKESLTIVVQGFGPATQGPARAPSAGTALPVIGGTPVGRSVMTLRATKADLDLFAKGQLNQAQFEERVQVATY